MTAENSFAPRNVAWDRDRSGFSNSPKCVYVSTTCHGTSRLSRYGLIGSTAYDNAGGTEVTAQGLTCVQSVVHTGGAKAGETRRGRWMSNPAFPLAEGRNARSSQAVSNTSSRKYDILGVTC